MDYSDNDVDYSDLAKQAQFGCQESMNRLAQLAEGRLCAYIYRLTLDYDLTQDLLQETLLEMVKSLKKLECVDAFWTWLYRTAMGKAQHYFRDQRKRAIVQMSAVNQELLSKHIRPDYSDGLNNMIRQEMSEAIFKAMAKLKFTHRNVLVLRCFEQRSYAEIAALMDCSEMAAQVLFFRAKRSLKRQLSKHGFGKGWLLMALGLFARVTAPAKAAPETSSVTAASLTVGPVAAVIGAVGTELGIATVTAVTAIALVVGAVTVQHGNSTIASAGPSDNSSSAPALGNAVFEYPYQLLRAYDPDGDGWKGIQANETVSVPILPENWLVGRPRSEQSSVVLPVDHWVELKFRGNIVDGPGYDIFLVEWGANGEQARVFITDGVDNEYLLGTATTATSGLQVPTEVGFDIAGMSLPFVPRAVRILAIEAGGGTPGFDLHSVRARTSTSRDGY
jgi:RNA polymerase sigma-70 factor (ECF subfamily)